MARVHDSSLSLSPPFYLHSHLSVRQHNFTTKQKQATSTEFHSRQCYTQCSYPPCEIFSGRVLNGNFKNSCAHILLCAFPCIGCTDVVTARFLHTSSITPLRRTGLERGAGPSDWGFVRGAVYSPRKLSTASKPHQQRGHGPKKSRIVMEKEQKKKCW
jgi:hypothetical protein